MTLLSLPTLDDLRIEPGLPTVVSRGSDGMRRRRRAAGARDRGRHARTGGRRAVHGFHVPSIDAFQQFAASFGDPLIGYEYASTPRSQAEGAVYVDRISAARAIPLHNEQSSTREWPLRIWFHCALAAPKGGATPIADSRAVYRALDPALIARFEKRELLYVRNFGQPDLPQQQSFGTDEPAEVERMRGARHRMRMAHRRRRRSCCAPANAAAASRAIRAPVTACGSTRRTCFTCRRSTTTCRKALVARSGLENVPRNVLRRWRTARSRRARGDPRRARPAAHRVPVAHGRRADARQHADSMRATRPRGAAQGRRRDGAELYGPARPNGGLMTQYHRAARGLSVGIATMS